MKPGFNHPSYGTPGRHRKTFRMPVYQIQTFLCTCFFGLWLGGGVFIGQQILGLEFYAWVRTFESSLYFWGLLVGVPCVLWGIFTLFFYGIMRDFKCFQWKEFIQMLFALVLWGSVFGVPVYLIGDSELILSMVKILIMVGGPSSLGTGVLFLFSSLGEILFLCGRRDEPF